MSLIDKLQSFRKSIEPVEIQTKTLGKVQLLPLFMEERLEFIHQANTADSKNYSLLLVAMCLADKGHRLKDSLGIEEVLGMINPLGATSDGMEDLNDLFAKANEISAVTQADVEDAQKNL